LRLYARASAHIKPGTTNHIEREQAVTAFNIEADPSRPLWRASSTSAAFSTSR
jgi:hypothetical protein